jgi:hypothetical protein
MRFTAAAMGAGSNQLLGVTAVVGIFVVAVKPGLCLDIYTIVMAVN